jgi:hypothetical protein
MSTDFNYIRQVKLTIGPNSGDLISYANTSDTLTYFSDGSRDGLRIVFNIVKTINGAPNQSKIEIYNVSPEHRQAMLRQLANIELEIGWSNKKNQKIASGGLLSVATSREPPDNKTELIFFDGYVGLVKGTDNFTIGSSTDIDIPLKRIVGNMPGVNYHSSRVDVKGKLGPRGSVFTGSSSDNLNDLAIQFGFSWSIQDGTFQALDDNRVFSKAIEISSRKGNLFKAMPILVGSSQQRLGVEVTAFIDPTALPGDLLILQSDINPELDGAYKIHDITFAGDTFGDTWEMKITSKGFSDGTILHGRY